MPEFIANHTPTGLDEFTTGYLKCAEWLAICTGSYEEDRADFSLTSEERDNCKGFTRKAISQAKRDCRDFQRANKDTLQVYYGGLGYGPSQAGHDFWLTRNHHGAGFWDRYYGNDKAIRDACKLLTDMSHSYWEVNCELYRNLLHMSG